MTLIDLPGGGQVEVPEDVTDIDPGITVHQHKSGLRVIDRWQKENFMALHRSFGPEFQELENAMWDVLASRYLDYAQGESLRFLGKIVGQPKGGRNTALFRTWIRARIRINASLGKPLDVLEVIGLVEAQPRRYLEYWPASFDVEFTEPPDLDPAELAALISATRAAGIWGSVVAAEVADSGALLMSYDEDEASDDQGLADSAETIGGLLANVYPT